MMERDSSAASRLMTSTSPGRDDLPGRASSARNSAETAVAVEFVASLFCHRDDDSSSSTSPCAVVPPDWNVTFPGLSLEPPDDDGEENNAYHHHHPFTTTSIRHAAEVRAVTLLRRPGRTNTSLRENAFASFITLVDARLNAYVRRWPAVAGLLLQYRIRPATLLSRLEVLQQQEQESISTAHDTELALCCWSMAMDLILEPGPAHHQHANNDGPNDTTKHRHPVMSVSFSTLGSISRDSSHAKHLIVELDLQVLLAEMIRQASVVVSAMVKLVGLTSSPPLPPPPITTKELNMGDPLALANRHPPPVHQGASSTAGSGDNSCDHQNHHHNDVSMMPPPPPRYRKRPAVMVVSPDLSSTTAVHGGVVPALDLDNNDNQALSVDQCANIIDTCLTEFTPMMTSTPPSKRTKLVVSSKSDP